MAELLCLQNILLPSLVLRLSPFCGSTEGNTYKLITILLLIEPLGNHENLSYQRSKEPSNCIPQLDSRKLHPSFPNSHALREMVCSREDANEKMNWFLWDRASLPPFRHFQDLLERKTRMGLWKRCCIYRVNIYAPCYG